jgi:hypothetical protein
VAASSGKGNRMTGNFEQPKHTGGSAAWPEASTSLVQADDIIMPEELAAYAFSLRSPRGSRNRGSRCQTPGFTRRPAGAATLFQVPLRLPRCALPLRFAQPGRNRADSMPASRALRSIQLGAPWFAYSGNMADRPGAPGQNPACPKRPKHRNAPRQVPTRPA